MDSFEFNKIAAAVLIALLVIKGADLISNHLIEPQMLKENVYKIAGVSPSSSEASAEVAKKGPAPIEPLLAAANVQQGEVAFKKCTSCHTIEKGGPNRIGPDLYGVVGAPKGQHQGYAYSSALEKKGGTWTLDDLNEWLYSPRDFVPGTKMSFAGVKDDKERADLIAYMMKQSDSPMPLPEVKEAVPSSKEPEPKNDVKKEGP
ncbi:cytochrome c family protein [Kamptonema cortianum]|jgi:cytochrome c|nr:cytochrome c family protein [Geitlerinema splendidum]MDK3160684.1 cytochrome c family protein [Kamptonema cortianum]